MDQIQMTPRAAIAATSVESAERVTAFLRKVYGWMCVGLAITAIVALGVASSPAIVQAIFGNKILFFGLMSGRARPRLLSLRAHRQDAPPTRPPRSSCCTRRSTA